MAIATTASLGCWGAPDRVDSGVDDEKRISALTSEEATAFCVALFDFMVGQSGPEEHCAGSRYGAARAEFMRTADDDLILEACLRAEKSCGHAAEPAETDCEHTHYQFACDARLGDVEGCFTDHIRATSEALLDLPPCETMTAVWFMGRPAVGSQLPASEACGRYAAACSER